MLALRGTHAHRTIALEQFARIESFLRRVFQIFDLQVVVEVDEVLGKRVIEDGKAMRGAARAARDDRAVRRAVAGMSGGLRSCAPAVGEPRFEVVDAVHSAGRENSRRRLRRDELLQLLGKSRAAAGLEIELRGSRPSDTHQYRVAVDAPR